MRKPWVRIEIIDKEVSGPKFSTSGSACLDLFCREDTLVHSVHHPPVGHNPVAMIPLNIKIQSLVPYLFSQLFCRSSLPVKKGLIVANSVGIIDNDFNDEVKLLVFNLSDDVVTIKRGEKIAQLLFTIPIIAGSHGFEEHVEFGRVSTTDDHRGFGSTGA